MVFDGFTGFTPIQNRLIQELMCVCSEVIVTVTLGAGENPYSQGSPMELFHLSKKTVADLEKLALSAQDAEGKKVVRKKDVFILRGEETGKKTLPKEVSERCDVIQNPGHRFTKAPAPFGFGRESVSLSFCAL